MSKQNKGSPLCLDFINTRIHTRRGVTHCLSTHSVSQTRSERTKSKTEGLYDADPLTYIHTSVLNKLLSL